MLRFCIDRRAILLWIWYTINTPGNVFEIYQAIQRFIFGEVSTLLYALYNLKFEKVKSINWYSISIMPTTLMYGQAV